MKTNENKLLMRLQDSAIAMRNAAVMIQQQLVGAGCLQVTMEIKRKIIIRLRDEADQNMAFVKAKAAEKEGTDGCLEG